MIEYRARVAPSLPVVPPLVLEKWQTLDSQYGLDDMFDTPITSSNEMTTNEEYAAYVNGSLSPAGTVLLTHWEVSPLIICGVVLI